MILFLLGLAVGVLVGVLLLALLAQAVRRVALTRHGSPTTATSREPVHEQIVAVLTRHPPEPGGRA